MNCLLALSASTPFLTPVCLQVFQTPIKLDARTISAQNSYLWTSEAMSTRHIVVIGLAPIMFTSLTPFMFTLSARLLQESYVHSIKLGLVPPQIGGHYRSIVGAGQPRLGDDKGSPCPASGANSSEAAFASTVLPPRAQERYLE